MTTWRRRAQPAACALIIALATALLPTAVIPASATPQFVTRAGTRLMLNGHEFRFSGVNIYSANSDGWCGPDYTDQQLEDAFAAISGPGDDPVVVRAWFFQSLAAAKTPGTTHQWSGARDWTRMDRMLAIAADHNVKVIPTLTDNWGECGGGTNYAKDWTFYESGYLTPDPVEASQYDNWVSYMDWVTEIVDRYRTDPTVLFWQLINEAEVLPNNQCAPGPEPGDILKAWADDVSTHVRSLDPNHLISLGTIGSGQCGTPSTEYKRVHDLPNIDLCEYHDYDPNSDMPGDQWNGLQERINECNELDKPLFVGEVGIIPNDVGGTYEARADRLRSKIIRQEGAGVVGHVAWAYMRTGSQLTIYDIGAGDPALEVLQEAPAWVVNSTSDTNDGTCDTVHCSLREAIEAANANAGADTIGFNLASAGAGVQTIVPDADLPILSGPTIVDGTTDPNGAVELDGTNVPEYGTGLDFAGGDSRLEGMFVGGFHGFFGAGVVLGGSGHNVVVGNVIGLRPDMATTNPNWLGIRVLSAQNSIGVPGNGNVIGGNADHGIQVGMAESPGLDTHGNVIQANVIGYSPGPDGDAILPAPNGFYGIELNTTTGTLVGGPGAGEGNTISGNTEPGIVVTSPGNVIQGNRIGTDVTGMVAVPNSAGIVAMWATDTQIGGTAAGEGNLISGNLYYGIQADGQVQGTTIEGNLIGTDETGTAPLPNGIIGVFLSGTGITVGGTAAGSANVISGNGFAGVYISSSAASGNLVAGNLIGAGSDATTVVANGNGVWVDGGATDNEITTNLIAHNQAKGVGISQSATSTAAFENSIFDNGDIGIDLAGDGVTANDSDDADTGPNSLQNAPELLSAESGAATTTISGSLDGAPGTTGVRLDFYSNTACDPSGYGEGETWLGSQTYTPNAAGDVTFAFTSPTVAPVGSFVTATASTVLAPSTWESSEFSACQEVTVATGPDSVTATVPAGGSATTDQENDGATPADTTETTVTSPNAGTISITENPTTGGAPVGYSIIGFDIAISAPAGTAAHPIRIAIRLDASAIPVGHDETTLQLLRNGVALPDCSGAAGVASPDPCVAQRSRLGDGDIQLVALTSAASLWQLATVTPYQFSGFFQPVTTQTGLNSANSGQAVPIKFSLGGNRGLGVLASGWPKVGVLSCATPSAPATGWTAASSASGLSYDAKSGQYSFVWKTDKSWTGSCRQIAVRFDDGSVHAVRFRFTK